ncbi:MAG TPA: DUF222 domain-containing protein [Arthrobacter sp.]|nr:DUF222 domain-containing protein [Arthrobacter sp.]
MAIRVDVDDGGASRCDDDGGSAFDGGMGGCGSPGLEPGVRAELELMSAVIGATEFMDEPVLAEGIVNGLAGVDVELLDYRQAVNLLDEAGRLASAAEALKAKAVARVCATAGDRAGEEDVLPPAAGVSAGRLASMVAESEIRTVLDLSNMGVQKLIHHSELLTAGLPATLEALGDGKLHPEQVQAIVDQCGSLPPEAYTGFEQEMVEFAPGRAKHLVAAKGRRLREKTHPESIKRRRQKAAADRTVILEPVEDGMCWLSMYLPAEAGVAAFNRLSALAGSLRGPDEARTISQLRADVAADLLHSGTGTGQAPAALVGTANDAFYAKPGRNTTGNNANNGSGNGKNNNDGGTAGGRGTDGGVPVGPAAAGVAGTAGATDSGSGRIPNYAGIKAEVFVVVPVLTLMGLSDEPADLEGYGPVDEDTVRELAVNAPSFKRLLTHPETGALLSYGQDRYGVPKDLQNMVRLRDRRCRGVGCNKAARACELDHSVPYPAGGTNLTNLRALCKPEHLLKTARMWTDVQHRDGTIDWTSPAGRKYTTTPDGPLPDMRPVPDIAHLLNLAKNQGGSAATPQMKTHDGSNDDSSNDDARNETDSGMEGKQDSNAPAPHDPDEPPPF